MARQVGARIFNDKNCNFTLVKGNIHCNVLVNYNARCNLLVNCNAHCNVHVIPYSTL